MYEIFVKKINIGHYMCFMTKALFKKNLISYFLVISLLELINSFKKCYFVCLNCNFILGWLVDYIRIVVSWFFKNIKILMLVRNCCASKENMKTKLYFLLKFNVVNISFKCKMLHYKFYSFVYYNEELHLDRYLLYLYNM